jgi:NhaA family Na+:H+ antiporter
MSSSHSSRLRAFAGSAGGVLLMLCAVLALAWANSPWAGLYHALWRWPIGLFGFERSLAFWINDGLMAVFFLTVGLEIRIEAHAGVLSDWRRAALPIVAALGGMLIPAATYLALVTNAEHRSGWGTPMATDIAFALGILGLLGKRVPPALRVLLLALAVIDDLGAIVVIALFYSASLEPTGLGIAALALLVVWALRRAGVRAPLAYVVPAVALWAGVYRAGIHPTIAGVALGAMTPVTRQGREVDAPARSLLHALEPWMALAVMPLFALANAGLVMSELSLAGDTARIALGVGFGLWLGKPLGVVGACLLFVRSGLGRLPPGVSTAHLLVLGAIAGVGFTMALFIAQLAFQDAALLSAAKLGVLVGSLLAGLSALLLGRALLSRP